ncbi:tight adherence protein B [Pseudonocardia endophytica]|uniref:Tight adherence protein B n=1 Tax=Pseudonocardia endophytica TaxID=401976 RepID=A0A4R1I9X2_PSEEN|nr:tight adherence protein B [Pseudonocardia endophytica]
MTAAALCALAGAVLCLPRSPGSGRLRHVAPLTATGRRGGDRLRRYGPGALALACGVVGAAALGPVGGVIAAVGVVGVRRVRRRLAADRRTTSATTELADALARISDELRSGAHPAAALAGVVHDGPLARRLLAPADAAARLGEPVPDALRRGARSGTAAAETERVAAAWELADRYGAPLADLLSGVLDDVRWRLGHASRVRAQLAGPRSTATVLTALPLLGVGLGQMMGTDPLAVLRDGLLGQGLLLLGCGLTAAGMAWSDRILRSAVPT